MAAIAPITIADGQATPADHTFNPVQTNPPLYRENGSAGVPLVGESELQISLKRASGRDAVNKARVTLKVPVLETTSGSTVGGYAPAPKVAYFHMGDVTIVLPTRGTAAQRKDLRVMLANALLSDAVASVVDSVETPY